MRTMLGLYRIPFLFFSCKCFTLAMISSNAEFDGAHTSMRTISLRVGGSSITLFSGTDRPIAAVLGSSQPGFLRIHGDAACHASRCSSFVRFFLFSRKNLKASSQVLAWLRTLSSPTIVRVLPVPGGPWMRVALFSRREELSASIWGQLYMRTSSADCISGTALGTQPAFPQTLSFSPRCFRGSSSLSKKGMRQTLARDSHSRLSVDMLQMRDTNHLDLTSEISWTTWVDLVGETRALSRWPRASALTTIDLTSEPSFDLSRNSTMARQ
mmetsp:Transcript_5295/g.13845  ORF Transcript_5295/g.13845 Transcript_5295/m.13845 type:complete len:269 (+) Transcript_5295:211-1017(+)